MVLENVGAVFEDRLRRKKDVLLSAWPACAPQRPVEALKVRRVDFVDDINANGIRKQLPPTSGILILTCVFERLPSDVVLD